MKKKLAAVAAALALVSGGFVAAAPATAAGNTLVVNASQSLRTVTHVGSGALYGYNGSAPNSQLLLPLRLNQMTQPAPGSQQSGGQGDVLEAASNITGTGAQSYMRMPDIFPDWPYRWVSQADWESKVRQMVNARLAATDTTNLNGWELWNEPDHTWDWNAAGDYHTWWERTFNLVRSLDPATPIVGPSTSWYDRNFISTFLTRAKASNTLPDVMVWHELNGWDQIDEHVADYRALEASLGISPRRISINEYGTTTDIDVPSASLRYMAQFERTGISDAQRAYWFGEAGTMDGLVHNNQPTGMYWLYKWYGDMAGNMIPVTPAGPLDGMAALDATRKIVNVVFGGDSGTNSVRVTGLSGFGTSARVTLSYTPYTGRHGVVAAPTTISSATQSISNGTVNVSVPSMNADGAYQIVVTPAAGPTSSWQRTYEAENATVVNATRYTSSGASNGGYVGGINGTGNSREDAFIDFIVNVPTTGNYTMAVRYANGGTATATHGVAWNGSAFSDLAYPVTGGWGVFGTPVTKVLNLTAGYNIIRIAKGSPDYGGGSGYAELDSITLIP